MKFRSFITACIATFAMAESASALSCIRPDLAATMEKAKASETTYYILVGTFRSQYARPQPKRLNGDYTQPTATRATMIFEGRGLGQRAWQDTRLSHFPVEVHTSCAGPWCGSLPQSGDQQIAFVEARPGQLPLLRIGPCPEWMFRLDSQSDRLRRLRDCFDKPCKTTRLPDYY